MHSAHSGGRLRKTIAAAASVLFAAVFTLGTVREAEAAATVKKYYVPTKHVETYEYLGFSPSKNTTKYTYYTGTKTGLLRQSTRDNGNYTVYQRDSAGLVTHEKDYNDSGQMLHHARSTISGGKVKRVHYYSVDTLSGAETHVSRTTLSYSGGRVVKMSTVSDDGAVSTISYNSRTGKTTEMSYQYKTSTGYTITEDALFNTKGYPVRFVLTSKASPDEYEKQTFTYKYSYTKKGLPSKVVITDKYVEQTGGKKTTATYVYTNTNKYTYSNAGNMTKKVATWKLTFNNKTEKILTKTDAYTYKGVSVKNKFWDLMDGKAPIVPGEYNSLGDLTNDSYSYITILFTFIS